MLARLVEKGKWAEASDELCQEQYSALCSVLAEAGYNHYEISNFAQPGHEAVHNSAYWRHVPYVGFGPGAHSYKSQLSQELPSDMPEVVRRLPERQWNLPDLQAYIEAGKSALVQSGAADPASCDPFASVREGETLDEEQLALERLMLGLRTSAGVPESFIRSHCDSQAIAHALAAGHLELADSVLPAADIAAQEPYLRIPERHFFISDAIIADLA